MDVSTSGEVILIEGRSGYCVFNGWRLVSQELVFAVKDFQYHVFRGNCESAGKYHEREDVPTDSSVGVVHIIRMIRI